MTNTQQTSDPFAGLYADATGRGVVLNQPVAAPNQAQINQQTFRPQGGTSQPMVNASPSFLGGAAGGLEQANESYLEALFNGEQLSEAFKEKASLIFTAALNEKVNTIEQAILQANSEVLHEEVTAGIEAGVGAGLVHITEAVDKYLTYVGKEWLVENKLEIEAGFRTEIAENFINGLKSLFENSFMEVPEEKKDIVDDLFDSNAKIEKALNDTIKENLELKSKIIGQLCVEQFAQISNGLRDTEIEKLAVLAESVEFSSVEQYAQKIQLLKESYFGNGSSKNTTTQSDDSPVNSSTSTATPLMENYVQAISRQLKLTNNKK